MRVGVCDRAMSDEALVRVPFIKLYLSVLQAKSDKITLEEEKKITTKI